MAIDSTVVWLISGLAFVILELVTGTFYLIVLGIACFVGAGVAMLGGEFLWQALIASAVAGAGLIVVQKVKEKTVPAKMPGLDVGQPAAFDSWVSKAAGQARVKYRDTLWDADVTGDIAGEPGEILYVNSVNGNSLKVSKTRAA